MEGNAEISAREDGHDGLEDAVSGGIEGMGDVFEGVFAGEFAGVEAEDSGAVRMRMPG